ncbi:MAG: flagellar M-ring protein FliF [Alphaproteobacteria bacterium]|jgi:flagellar M-ring protein FliF|nr:flagellar M-ring protein FliF [Alphaproteobacteria bacterium]
MPTREAEGSLPEFLRAIGAARFGVMAGVAAALTAFFLYVAGVIAEPPKSILYAGLESRDAAQVTAKLDAMNVPYEMKGDGSTILVPADQVTKLRMELASQNLPSAGVGYEIFDKSDSFGATAFVQNINRLRALEGELARSIQTINGIEAARVHLVIPEREIFSRDAQPPSASVVLRTRGHLDHGQVQAIQHLVAAAVANMDAGRVAVIDDRGNLLAGGDAKSGDDADSAMQEQQASNFEDRLRQRIETMLAGIVGAGHVRVQVSADIDHNKTSETSETYDPDSKVVRSTQTVEQSSSDSQDASGANAVSVANALPNGQTQPGGAGNGDKSSSTRNEETTNYEISKTVRTKTANGGDVKRLSVAVAVDGTTTTGADGAVTYKPRSAQEMAKIESLVKSAIGFDKARGDQVQVVNMPFARLDVGEISPLPTPLLGLDGNDWFRIIKIAILSLAALLVGFFVARPMIVRTFSSQSAIAPAQIAAGQLAPPQPGNETVPAAIQSQGGNASLPGPKESMIDIQRIEGQVRESSVRKVGEVVQAHPEEALSILRTWLHEPA